MVQVFITLKTFFTFIVSFLVNRLGTGWNAPCHGISEEKAGFGARTTFEALSGSLERFAVLFVCEKS